MKLTKIVWIVLLGVGCLDSDDIDDRRDGLTDIDNDGYTSVEFGGDDCDDSDKDIHPGATEQPYDGMDNDCSESTPDDDLDGDNYGIATDCDDENADINPGMNEFCDDVDNNCNEENNEAGSENETLWYADNDGDGFGDINSPLSACDMPLGYVVDDQDCNDAEPTANPDGVETCETSFDDDCNGETNEPEVEGCTPYFIDMDGDGYGIPSYLCICEPKENYTALEGTDCNDGNNAISPAGLETLDDTDDSDCDGDIDSFRFQSVNNYASVDAIGPRLRASGDSFYLVWLTEEFNPGSGTEYDGGLIIEYDAEDTAIGEIDVFSFGTSGNTQALAPKFDFTMNEDYWMIGRGGTNGTNRYLSIDLADRATQSVSHYTETANASDTWDDIQIGYSSAGTLTLIACGLGSTGIQILQGSVPTILSGTNVPSYVLKDWEGDVCEYNNSIYNFYYGDSVQGTLNYFGYYASSGQFQVYSTYTDTEITDIEVTRSASGYNTIFSYDSSGKSYIYVGTAANNTNTFASTLSIADVDITISPSNGSVACGVASNGDLFLYYANIDNGESLTAVSLDPGVAADECAITATDGAKIALSVRSGDDFYIGFTEYP
jgi:hypothetical protein